MRSNTDLTQIGASSVVPSHDAALTFGNLLKNINI